MRYKSNRNIVYLCKYHIIWCPKYRRKILVNNVQIRLKEIIKEIANKLNVQIIEIETNKDHIHILAEIDPQFSVNKFVRIAKGKTSYILRKEFAYLKKSLPTLWTNSYFVSTVGGAPLSTIKKYISNQN
jgi:putative transposase